jgi:hypothetical protein
MAITGKLITAQAQFVPGGCVLVYGVDLFDDVLGALGNRAYTVTDPQTNAQVLAYVEQMLPSMEAQTGFPITLPAAPDTE